MGYMYAQPGKKLLFMGGEIGQWSEWYHETGLDWHLLDLPFHSGLKRWVKDLNHLYRSEAALHELPPQGERALPGGGPGVPPAGRAAGGAVGEEKGESTKGDANGPSVEESDTMSDMMTKEAIIEEAKKLSVEDQRDIVEALRPINCEDYELRDEEKKLVDRRWKRMQEHPEESLSLEELKKRVSAGIGR